MIHLDRTGFIGGPRDNMWVVLRHSAVTDKSHVVVADSDLHCHHTVNAGRARMLTTQPLPDVASVVYGPALVLQI